MDEVVKMSEFKSVSSLELTDLIVALASTQEGYENVKISVENLLKTIPFEVLTVSEGVAVWEGTIPQQKVYVEIGASGVPGYTHLIDVDSLPDGFIGYMIIKVTADSIFGLSLGGGTLRNKNGRFVFDSGDKVELIAGFYMLKCVKNDDDYFVEINEFSNTEEKSGAGGMEVIFNEEVGSDVQKEIEIFEDRQDVAYVEVNIHYNHGDTLYRLEAVVTIDYESMNGSSVIPVKWIEYLSDDSSDDFEVLFGFSHVTNNLTLYFTTSDTETGLGLLTVQANLINIPE